MPLIDQYPFAPVVEITAKIGDRLQISTAGDKWTLSFIPAGNGAYHYEEQGFPDGGYFNEAYVVSYIVPDAAGHIDYYLGNSLFGPSNLSHYVVTVLDKDGRTPQQTAPVATDDHLSTRGDTQYSISNALLLTNDFDAENDVLKIDSMEVISGNAHAEINYSVGGDGSFRIYPHLSLPDGSPDLSFDETVDVAYTVTDSRGGISTATAHIKFIPTEHKPVASIDAYSTSFQSPLKVDLAHSVLINDSDADKDVLIAVLRSAPEHGALALNSDGTFSYTPEAGFSGKDSFTYFASDGSYSSADTLVEISVGAAPVPVPHPQTSFIKLTTGSDSVSFTAATAGVLVQALGGNDSITGSRFADSINGGAGNDLLRGGAGKDVITGGAGIDRVSGGTDNDTFAFAKGDLVDPSKSGGQMDHIIDFRGAGGYAAGENDFLRFTGFGKGALVFDHDAGGDPYSQIYQVQDEAGVYQGSLLVQMSDTTKHLAAGDYVFA